ncbi:protein-tyrosine phosphatase [Arthrobacter subterraneus]|jgi:protein-tyrosine phosphatase|uniref:protein-tyrosine-phosphatase n=1 Tax=Arthrobacter subterraneus TaxID=335973 RepID=A0A1G8DCN6_9MICC|nr:MULTISPECIES: low molecular weight protein-tyrosine-phosphatase [Arthrobacter]SDH55492.1 protein-tyrosine phosphatase [Arthrobacter subterraneus]
MYRIVTVCTGNICRSPMAEIMLTQAFEEAGLGGEVLVDSAGTTGWESGNPIDERAAAKLTELGLASEAHRARQFDPGWYAERDLILALDVDHYEDLKLEAPDAESRGRVRMLREFDPSAAGTPVSELGIYDPWYGDRADFEATWQMIHDAVPGIVQYVQDELARRRASR